MIKNFILKKLFPLIIIIFGLIFLVDYLDISPEIKAYKKKLSNEIIITVK